MKFQASRTSKGDEEMPFARCKNESWLRVETRTVTESEFNRKFSHDEGLWRSKGLNHRVDKEGYINRDHEDCCWTVEVSSLKQLIELVENEGDIVIGKSSFYKDLINIEIYDDYRE